MTALLEVEGLAVAHGPLWALDHANLAVGVGEVVGVIGESGSGKTTLGLAVGRLLAPAARILAGTLRLDGQAVADAGDDEIRQLRRQLLGFVFQNPFAALDPTMRIGRQVRRAIGPGATPAAAMQLLARVSLPAPERVLASFPHQLSGGMAQRVAIALAVARGPRLLVADEPTAALDAGVRGEVLALLRSFRDERGMALLLLSHDLRAVGAHADRVAVMYAGRVVEDGAGLFARPAHPYTRALLTAAPGAEAPGGAVQPIPGGPPLLLGSANNCAFAPRCAWAVERCRSERPAERPVAGRRVACHRAEEVLAA